MGAVDRCANPGVSHARAPPSEWPFRSVPGRRLVQVGPAVATLSGLCESVSVGRARLCLGQDECVDVRRETHSACPAQRLYGVAGPRVAQAAWHAHVSVR